MKNSKERLEALSKEFRKRLKEERKSGISSKDFPSLTLAEARELGWDTGTTVVVSFGKKRK
jgi:hypothetical protein